MSFGGTKVAALVLIVSLTGCATYRESRRAARVGGTVALVGAGLGMIGLAVALFPPAGDASVTVGVATGVVGGLGFFGGGGVAIGGLVGMAALPDERVDEAGEHPVTPRERAAQLTEIARAAVAIGNCARVRELDVEVAALDAEFYASVFLRDRGIRACVGK